jgi:hypothetical protein
MSNGPRSKSLFRLYQEWACRTFRSKRQRSSQQQEVKSRASQTEGLEPRTLLTAGPLIAHPVFAVGTPQSLVDQYIEETPAGLSAFQFSDNNRWDNTTTSGNNLDQGDATTITWSLAPDGTTIPNFIGETQGGANNFVAFIRGIYNDSSTDSDYTDEPWFDVIESVFDRWSELSGITYVYEPNDDGIAFSDFASQAPGVVGVRGDVRIGGHNIDGNSGILAYNFFPTSAT